MEKIVGKIYQFSTGCSNVKRTLEDILDKYARGDHFSVRLIEPGHKNHHFGSSLRTYVHLIKTDTPCSENISVFGNAKQETQNLLEPKFTR